MYVTNNFATSGMWDYRNAIVPVAATLPLAVEGAVLAKNIYQKPHVIKEKWIVTKKRVIESFTFHKGEKRLDGILRIAKNSFILLSCLVLMAGAVYGSGFLLPSALAITTAISAVFLIGKLFANAKEYKKQLIEAFTVKAGEDPEAAKKRIRKNILKAMAIAVMGIAAIAIGAYILAPMITNGFSFAVSLPWQTPAVVFAEYAAVGVVHGGLAIHKWRKWDKWGALFHLFAGALSFAFPAAYLTNATAAAPMRLHHSFSGLLLMALPYRPLQMFGSMVTFDSALYWLAPVRGYLTPTWWGGTKMNQYDFINDVVDNYPLFAGGLAGGLMLENINENWKEENPKPKKVEQV